MHAGFGDARNDTFFIYLVGLADNNDSIGFAAVILVLFHDIKVSSVGLCGGETDRRVPGIFRLHGFGKFGQWQSLAGTQVPALLFVPILAPCFDLTFSATVVLGLALGALLRARLRAVGAAKRIASGVVSKSGSFDRFSSFVFPSLEAFEASRLRELPQHGFKHITHGLVRWFVLVAAVLCVWMDYQQQSTFPFAL